MKILVFKPGDKVGVNLIDDIVDGMHLLKCEVKIVDFKPPGVKLQEIIDGINAFPHFIFTINHIGLIPPVMQEIERRKVPYASWFTDDPFRYLRREHLSSYCALFICDKIYMDRVRRFGFEKVFYLPGATNPKRFRPMELSEEDKSKYECNISFVGNSGSDVLKTYKKYREWLTESALRKAVEEIVEIQAQNPLLNISDVIGEVEEALNLTLPNPEGEGGKSLSVCLEFAAMALRRIRMIKVVGDFGVNVYGDEGWLESLDQKSQFRGMIDYQTELPKLYNASKINLNVTKSQLKTAINQRVFDISACGAFILTDYRRDLLELFEVDKEVVYYKDEQDLREKVEYFLKNPKAREALSNNARKKVLEKYTYEKMIKQVLEVMRELFSL